MNLITQYDKSLDIFLFFNTKKNHLRYYKFEMTSNTRSFLLGAS